MYQASRTSCGSPTPATPRGAPPRAPAVRSPGAQKSIHFHGEHPRVRAAGRADAGRRGPHGPCEADVLRNPPAGTYTARMEHHHYVTHAVLGFAEATVTVT